jgi:hypothetical protein
MRHHHGDKWCGAGMLDRAPFTAVQLPVARLPAPLAGVPQHEIETAAEDKLWRQPVARGGRWPAGKHRRFVRAMEGARDPTQSCQPGGRRRGPQGLFWSTEAGLPTSQELNHGERHSEDDQIATSPEGERLARYGAQGGGQGQRFKSRGSWPIDSAEVRAAGDGYSLGR